MARFVWSLNPLAIFHMRVPEGKSPLSSSELACLGIPKHKIPRVEAELARLNSQTELDRALLPDLARQIARQLL